MEEPVVVTLVSSANKVEIESLKQFGKSFM